VTPGNKKPKLAPPSPVNLTMRWRLKAVRSYLFESLVSRLLRNAHLMSMSLVSDG